MIPSTKKKPEKVKIDLQTYLKKTMTKELQLTIGERIAAAKLFDEFKGSITQLAAVMDDIKGISITKEEWEKAGLVKTPTNEGKDESWTWEDEGSEKAFAFSQEAIDYLNAKIKEKSEANELTLSPEHKALVTLNKKLTA